MTFRAPAMALGGSAKASRLASLPRKPKVLFIINSLGGGGAERVMTQLLERSAPLRHEHAISLALLDDDARAYRLPEWVEVHQLDCKHRISSSIFQLRRLVRQLDPDVTLSFLTRANVASAFAAVGRTQPWLISERVNTPAHLGRALSGRATSALVQLTYPRASRVLCVSEGIRATLVQRYKVPADRCEVIANPVDVEAIRAAAAEPCDLDLVDPFIFAMGRLVPNKNFAMLLEAFARSRFKGGLVIAGEGPERPNLRALSERLGIADRLTLPGFLPNPHPVLARARIFALSSNAEGFPNALVEALALGVPVVATNCPDGPAEILAAKSLSDVRATSVESAGVLSPVGDAQAYAGALDLANDDEIRAQIIAGANQRLVAYSPAVSVERYWAVIREQLAKSARGHRLRS